MKKIIAIFALLALALSLCACNKDGPVDFHIAETRDIVLGDEVASVTVATADGGSLTFDYTADFYEILDHLNFKMEGGTKCSFTAEIKLGDGSWSYINMNAYHLEKADLYDFRVKKEGDETVAVIEEYAGTKQIEGGKPEMFGFGNYSYKNERAIGGNEGNVMYSSKEHPMMPESGTELCDMHVRANCLRNINNSVELLARYEAFEAGGMTYRLEDFVTREYKLYENYIVFKQTAPFLNSGFVGVDPHLVYAQIENSDCSVTQEVYFNVETGSVEFIKIYGDTMWLMTYRGRKAEFDIKIYVHELDVSEAEEKIQGLIDRVKSIADKE